MAILPDLETTKAIAAAVVPRAVAEALTPLQTSRATLAAGTLAVGVGTRLLDEFGPLRARAAGAGEVANNGTTYALPGGLIAEREDDGMPTHADWFAIPENTGGQTARWQAAADAAFKRKARVLEISDKTYILDGIITSKASIRGPGAQFIVPVGAAGAFTGKFSIVSETTPVVYSDAPHLVPGALPLTSFAPGMDAIREGVSVIPSLAAYANQLLSPFSSVPSTHRQNNLFDETYERMDCFVPDSSGQLSVTLAFDYAYPPAMLAAAEWSAATVYKHGDFVKKTVAGKAYYFVATYPSGPGTTLHTTAAAIGAQSPNETAVNTTVAGTAGGTFGGVRVWMQLYRRMTVYTNQRPVTVDVNVKVQGTHAVATNVLLSAVLVVAGRSDVTIHGRYEVDNPLTNVDSLVSLAHLAGVNILPGTRVTGARYTGLGYNIILTNVSRILADGVVSVGCRDGWAGRHGNNVVIRNSEMCRVDDHYGLDMFLDNVQLTTSDPVNYVYAMSYSGRNLTLRNVTARNALSLVGLRTDSAYRGGTLTLEHCTLIPSGSTKNSVMVYGGIVTNLSPGALACGFNFVAPMVWPSKIDVIGCNIDKAADGTTYNGARAFVELFMDTVNTHILPLQITVRDGVMNTPAEYGGIRLRFYGTDLSKYSGTTEVVVENTKALIGALARPGSNDTQAAVNAAWAAYPSSIVTYKVRGGKINLNPSLQVPAEYDFRGSSVDTFTATGADLPTVGQPGRAVVTAISSVLGGSADSVAPTWAPAYGPGTLRSRFFDCEFTKTLDPTWAAANIADANFNRAKPTTGNIVPQNVPAIFGTSASAAIAAAFGGKKFRALPANLTAGAAWMRLARVQTNNPVGATDFAAFAGELSMQPGRTGNAYRHYRAEFSFGGTYNNAATTASWQHQPILEEVYSNPNPTVEWRVVRTADGWVDVYVLIPSATSSIGIMYDLWNVAEPAGAWAYSDPPADSTLLWSSTTGARSQRNGGEIYVNGTRVLTTRQVAIPDTTGAALAAVETEVNKLKAMLRAHGLIA